MIPFLPGKSKILFVTYFIRSIQEALCLKVCFNLCICWWFFSLPC